eukprot:COSAG06_NODE_58084_length_278_cov_0.581006_1_plen_25_part_01
MLRVLSLYLRQHLLHTHAWFCQPQR